MNVEEIMSASDNLESGKADGKNHTVVRIECGEVAGISYIVKD